jgi:4-deoxy-L-threo-5-hexosulose-uronate ketol-isomerase
MSTDRLRSSFLVDGLFCADEICLVITDLDRAIVGGAIPLEQDLTLEVPDELRASYFCQRRELGIINLGGPGTVRVDGELIHLDESECLYVGLGSREITFQSLDTANPAKFYLLSYPAHASHPTRKATLSEANVVDLGSDQECNRRTIYQYIHEEGIQSCQLVMGLTKLHSGSCWNTMPCHTHSRRSEVYFYFGIDPAHQVLHQMGLPQETRGLWISDQQAVLSPAWSIHCGVGTSAYSFIWGMGGENQSFDDMDAVPITDLR